MTASRPPSQIRGGTVPPTTDVMSDEDAANYKLDPGRYMHNQSFFQRGLLGFAALLAGNANGNSVVDNFNKDVDRDLDAQKNEQQQLAKKGIDASNLLTAMEKGWGDEDAGYEAARAHVKSAYGHYVEQQTSTNESQKIRDLGHATNLKLQGVAAKDMAAAQAHRAAAAQDRGAERKRISDAGPVWSWRSEERVTWHS